MSRLGLLLLLLITTTACFAGRTGHLAGRVRDEEGKAISYVSLVLFKDNIRIETYALTKNNGTYIVRNLFPGRYELRFVHQGYQRLIITDVKIDADQTTTQNAILGKGKFSFPPIIKAYEPVVIHKDPCR